MTGKLSRNLSNMAFDLAGNVIELPSEFWQHF
jgi:hypothetical protein